VNLGIFIFFPFGYSGLTIIVRRHLSDQEPKFLGHVDADQKLLRHLRMQPTFPLGFLKQPVPGGQQTSFPQYWPLGQHP